MTDTTDPFAGDTLPPELALDADIDTPDVELHDPDYDLDSWVNSDERAEWMMRVLVRAQLRVIEHTLRRDAWVRRITDWYDQATQADRTQIERLTTALERYAVACRARDRNRKTVLLPSGEIATRREKDPRVEITDEKAVLVWAKDTLDAVEYERCVRTTQSPLISELRRVLRIEAFEDGDRAVIDKAGQIVPGVTIVDPATTATVKPRH